MKKVKMMMSKMNHKILMQIKSLCIGNLIRKSFLHLYDLDDHVSMEGRMNPLQTQAPHPLCLQKNVCTSLVVHVCTTWNGIFPSGIVVQRILRSTTRVSYPQWYLITERALISGQNFIQQVRDTSCKIIPLIKYLNVYV